LRGTERTCHTFYNICI